MLALAFDTATPMVSVALVHGDEVLAEQGVHAPNGQGETLAPLIQTVLRDARIDITAVEVIGVGLGPGPFTGLRVGVVTAAGLGDVLGVPVHGMCSLDAIAQAHRANQPFAVATDARRKQVYWAAYDANGSRTSGPELGPPADVAAGLVGQVGLVLGAGAVLYAEAFAAFAVDESSPWPSAAAIARYASGLAARDAVPAALEPLYLRRPDARPPGAPKRVTAP